MPSRSFQRTSLDYFESNFIKSWLQLFSVRSTRSIYKGMFIRWTCIHTLWFTCMYTQYVSYLGMDSKGASLCNHWNYRPWYLNQWTVFIPWAWTKTDIFWPPPPHLVHAVIECPLSTVWWIEVWYFKHNIFTRIC